jgi:hypothetical protein
MSLYVGRDYLRAKPLFEVLLDMNPADEEALSCFKVIFLAYFLGVMHAE